MANEKKLLMPQKNAKPEQSSFLYVLGDTNKTQVDIATQPRGTRLVLVTSEGTEYEIVAGVTNLQIEITPAIQAKIDRAKSWDAPDARFPNLSVTRES